MGTDNSGQKAPDRVPRMSHSPEAKKWRTDQLLSMAARVVERRKDQALAALGLTHAAVIALQGLAAGPLTRSSWRAGLPYKASRWARCWHGWKTRIWSRGPGISATGGSSPWP